MKYILDASALSAELEIIYSIRSLRLYEDRDEKEVESEIENFLGLVNNNKKGDTERKDETRISTYTVNNFSYKTYLQNIQKLLKEIDCDDIEISIRNTTDGSWEFLFKTSDTYASAKIYDTTVIKANGIHCLFVYWNMATSKIEEEGATYSIQSCEICRSKNASFSIKYEMYSRFYGPRGYQKKLGRICPHHTNLFDTGVYHINGSWTAEGKIEWDLLRSIFDEKIDIYNMGGRSRHFEWREDLMGFVLSENKAEELATKLRSIDDSMNRIKEIRRRQDKLITKWRELEKRKSSILTEFQQKSSKRVRH